MMIMANEKCHDFVYWKVMMSTCNAAGSSLFANKEKMNEHGHKGPMKTFMTIMSINPIFSGICSLIAQRIKNSCDNLNIGRCLSNPNEGGVPSDDALVAAENKLFLAEDEILGQFEGTAYFEVVPPNLEELNPNRLIGRVMKYNANALELVDVVRAFLRLLTVIYGMSAIFASYNYVQDFKELSFDNKYVTKPLKRKDRLRRELGKPYIFPLKKLEKKSYLNFFSLKIEPDEKIMIMKGVSRSLIYMGIVYGMVWLTNNLYIVLKWMTTGRYILPQFFSYDLVGFAQEKVRELHHKHEINVIGEGILAQIIRNTIR